MKVWLAESLFAPSLSFDELPLTSSKDESSAESSTFEISFDISFESEAELRSEISCRLEFSVDISIVSSYDIISLSEISSAEAVPTKDIKQNNIKIIKIELIILVLIKCPPFFNKLIY